MTTINESGFSKDYALLCELIKTQEIIVVIDDYVLNCVQYRTVTVAFSGHFKFNIHRYFNATDNKKLFIKECQRLNLSFVVPKED